MFELMPYRGSGSLQSLRKQMDDLWSHFMDAPLSSRFVGNDKFVPVMDVKETDSAIEITAEVPGMNPNEIEVSLSGNLLTIKGEKKTEKEEKKDNYHLVERSFGSFTRNFRLPMEIDPKKIEAKHKNGILHLVLPKVAKEAATKIAIKAA